MKARTTQWGRSALRLLDSLVPGPRKITDALRPDADALIRGDLAAEEAGTLAITDAGRSFFTRRANSRAHSQIDGFRAQHLSLAEIPRALSNSGTGAVFDEA